MITKNLESKGKQMVDIGLKKAYREVLRKPINKINRSRLRNRNPSIIANNCNGGVICHDLGLRFNSPTVNLYIPFPDYIRFCENLNHYLLLPKSSMERGLEVPEGCPVGMLEDIRLIFLHYSSFEQARDKWFDSAKRVNMNNLYFMLTQRDGCTDDDVRIFGSLPYEHKVAFTERPIPDVSCAFYIPEFVKDGAVKVLSDYTSHFSGKRIIDKFDYVGFLNEK